MLLIKLASERIFKRLSPAVKLIRGVTLLR